jgi:hypothetical protein
MIINQVNWRMFMRINGKMALIICSMFVLSGQAMATHAYLSEECTSETHSFRYEGNYPIGGYYGISKLNQEDKAVLIPVTNASEGPYDQDEIDSMDMLYTASDIAQTAPTEESSDDCFDTTVSHYRQTLTFQKVKAEAGNKVGITEGQSMVFDCISTSDIPNGKGCGM